MSSKTIPDKHICTVLVCALAIPLSMSMWIINIIYSKFINGGDGYDEPHVISPARWLVACVLPNLISIYGYRRKSVNLSGAVMGFGLGFILTLSNFGFFASLLAFFLSASRATKVRPFLKKKFEYDFKEGGQRSWVQALCNGGMATQLGLLYLLDVGATERPIDFVKDYRASWLSMGVLAVFACCNGDTWASELGTVIGNSEPVLITSFEKVPRGTNGGISISGTTFSFLGGLFVGAAQYVVTAYFADNTTWMYAPPQWPMILFGGIAGLIGSLIDSFLGATLQYSGLSEDGKVVNHPELSVKHISGRSILDNHSVNLVSTVIIGLVMPGISKAFWPTM